MTRADLKLALPEQPVDLWARLLGCTDEVPEAQLLAIEVLSALYGLQLIPRDANVTADTVTNILDALFRWAEGGEHHSVVVLNNRIIILRNQGHMYAIDGITGEDLKIPSAASPIVTTALHLQPLRESTLSNLESAKKKEARQAST